MPGWRNFLKKPKLRLFWNKLQNKYTNKPVNTIKLAASVIRKPPAKTGGSQKRDRAVVKWGPFTLHCLLFLQISLVLFKHGPDKHTYGNEEKDIENRPFEECSKGFILHNPPAQVSFQHFSN